MKTLSALLAAGIVTIGLATQIDDATRPAVETAGQVAIEEVVRAARTDFDLIAGRTTWEQALAEVPSRLISGAENISVSGTLVQWRYDTHCIEADVPGVWSPVVPRVCSETTP